MTWRERVAGLVRLSPTLRPPDGRFRIRPPSGLAWPADLPSGGTLPHLYAACDGGTFPDCLGWAEVFPLAELARRSREFGDRLTATLEAQGRASPFVPGRHVLFGWDTVGHVYRLWDAESDRLVGYMPADDHDWVGEPDAPRVDAYFEEFFSTGPARQVRGSVLSEWWMEALDQCGRGAEPDTARERPV